MALNQVGLERLGTSVTDKIGERKNKIINGAMQVAQRGTSTSGVTGIGYFACDRQKTLLLSAGTWTISQSTEAPSDNGLTNSMKYDCTTADASLGANDYLQHYYRIEGQDLQDVCKGTSNAKALTLSFWVKTNKTGTYNVEAIDQDNSRLCSFQYTVSNTNWNKYTITFPADTTGAFGNDTGASLDIGFWLAAGSTYTSGSSQNTFGSFVQANRAPSNVNLADSTSNEWYITGIQLEVGNVATDFEHRSFAQEIQSCYRYYYHINDSQLFGGRAATGGARAKWTMMTPVPLRASPTINTSPFGDTWSATGYKYNTTSTSTTVPTINAYLQNSCHICFSQLGHSLDDDRDFTWQANVDLALDAEL